MKVNKLAAAIIAVGFTAGLAGCGGSSSSSSDEPKVMTYAGVVETEGQLAGATVCLDENSNLVCDDGEASDTTNGEGEFSITTEETDASLVAESADVEGLTVAMSSVSASNVPPGLFLTAPNSSSFVSPLTTLTQIRARLSGASFAEAEEQVVSQLGLSEGTELTQFGFSAATPQAQTIIRIVSQVISQNMSVISASAGGSSNFAVQIALAVDDLLQTDGTGKSRLQTIAESVNSAPEGSNLGELVSGLVQQSTISADKVQEGLDRVESELNPEEPTPEEPTGATS